LLEAYYKYISSTVTEETRMNVGGLKRFLPTGALNKDECRRVEEVPSNWSSKQG